jgi:hypothetical protein
LSIGIITFFLVFFAIGATPVAPPFRDVDVAGTSAIGGIPCNDLLLELTLVRFASIIPKFWILGSCMKLGRDWTLLILALVLGCQGTPAGGERLPESLGTLPADLPLPPLFILDPGSGESGIATVLGRRKCTLFLKGPFSPAEIREFFLDQRPGVPRATRAESGGGAGERS